MQRKNYLSRSSLQGHAARLCPYEKLSYDLSHALLSKGNIGDSTFLVDRPKMVNIFLHDNSTPIRERDRLAKAYVIDTRFVTSHGTQTFSRDISHTLPRQTLYDLSHISSTYYLLMFNSHITNSDFKEAFKRHMSPLN
jgi:hypothetical protein